MSAVPLTHRWGTSWEVSCDRHGCDRTFSGPVEILRWTGWEFTHHRRINEPTESTAYCPDHGGRIP